MAATTTQYVTPICYASYGCMSFKPATPSSTEKIDVSVIAFSGIPTDACFPTLRTSVIDKVITISGAYVRTCPFISLGQVPSFATPLEPLAPGHYMVKFMADADPGYGPNGWVETPGGWVQAGVLISATLDVSASATAVPNYGGLWWASPADSESGWGINFAHQGSVIFATWFTYDIDGKGLWLSVAAFAAKPGTFTGTLVRATGPSFDASPFDPSLVTRTPVGAATFSFSGPNNGTFAYTLNGISQTKAITREVFGTIPNCTFGVESNLTLASNYQDIWWAAPGGSESGWGINLTQQGDTIVGTWFTYDHDGSPIWLIVAAPRNADGTFSGTLARTTGPPFDASPFDPSLVTRTPVGTASFAFSDGNHGVFTYTVNGVTQSKPITREVFSAPGTVCQ